jgi:hypothetical protein
VRTTLTSEGPRSSPVAEITSQKHAFETPKVQRPQDKAYQDMLSASKQQFQSQNEKRKTTTIIQELYKCQQ